MSEYQSYQWSCFERSLSRAHAAKISGFSSHISVSSSSAQVTYNYGDFKHDPIDVLTKYFDIFTFQTNWGSQRVVFRFDPGDVDEDMLALFTHSDVVKVKRTKKSIILDASWWEENYREGYWIPDESEFLGNETFHQIYRDILAGDFRAPFLLWLKSSSHCIPDRRNPSAPVPSGLAELHPDYHELMHLIALNQDLVGAAAEFPPVIKKRRKSAAPEGALEKLEPARMRKYLAKYLSGDPQKTTRELKAELRTLLPHPEQPQLPDKFDFIAFSDIAEREQAIIRAREQKLADEEKRQNEAYISQLTGLEEKIWQIIDALISEKTPKAYDQAVEYLKGLRHLYKHRDQMEKFIESTHAILERYPTLVGLRQRMERADLLSIEPKSENRIFHIVENLNNKSYRIDISGL